MNPTPSYENLYSFLCAEFAEADLDGKTDEEVILTCIKPELMGWHQTVLREGQQFLALNPCPWQEIGRYANRYFTTETDAKNWLTGVLALLTEQFSQTEG